MRATSRRTGSKPERTTASGRVVDDQVDAGCLLEGADVAALATDDAALHLLARQVDDRHGRLGGMVGRDALHDGGQDPSGALLALLLGTALDLADLLLRLRLRLVHDLRDERLACLCRRQAAQPLELDELLLLQLEVALYVSASMSRRRSSMVASRRSSASSLRSMLSERSSRRRSWRWRSARFSRASSSAARWSLERLVLALEDDLLLLGARLGHDPLGVAIGVVDRAGGESDARRSRARRRGRVAISATTGRRVVSDIGSSVVEPVMGDVAPAIRRASNRSSAARRPRLGS